MKAWASKYKEKEDLPRLKAVLETYMLMGETERLHTREDAEEVEDNDYEFWSPILPLAVR